MRARSTSTAPGIRAQETNRYNQLEASWFHDGARALLGPERGSLIAQYKFDLTPATDDRPYFFHFFRWRTLPELLRLKAQGGLPLLEWGYPLLVATLAQALLGERGTHPAAAVVVATPWRCRSRHSAVAQDGRILRRDRRGLHVR